jgi:hypothetical protein
LASAVGDFYFYSGSGAFDRRDMHHELTRPRHRPSHGAVSCDRNRVAPGVYVVSDAKAGKAWIEALRVLCQACDRRNPRRGKQVGRNE